MKLYRSELKQLSNIDVTEMLSMLTEVEELISLDGDYLHVSDKLPPELRNGVSDLIQQLIQERETRMT